MHSTLLRTCNGLIWALIELRRFASVGAKKTRNKSRPLRAEAGMKTHPNKFLLPLIEVRCSPCLLTVQSQCCVEQDCFRGRNISRSQSVVSKVKPPHWRHQSQDHGYGFDQVPPEYRTVPFEIHLEAYLVDALENDNRAVQINLVTRSDRTAILSRQLISDSFRCRESARHPSSESLDRSHSRQSLTRNDLQRDLQE